MLSNSDVCFDKKLLSCFYIIHIIITVIISIVIIIIILLTLIQFFLSSYSLIRDPQLTVLESGFERLKSRVLLRSSFFMIVALFVLFDLELILLFPGILYHLFIGQNWLVIWIFVVIVVIVTLFLEWVWFGLKWQV